MRAAAVALLLLLVLAAPLLAPYPPEAIDYAAVLAPPSPAHLLGTDDLGRDLLSRLLVGGRSTITTALLATALGLGAGLALGTAAGFLPRGNGTITRVVDVTLALPDILVALAVVAVLGAGSTALVVGLAVASAPGYTRLVRASVVAAARAPHLEAARAIGATRWHVAARHVLPAAAPAVAVYATVGLGATIGQATALSFLGLGAPPPSPEWGAMLAAGVPYLEQAWWVTTVPGAAVFLTVAAVNAVGDVPSNERLIHQS